MLLVVDGMTGQDAVNSAKAFNEALELDGVIMTKLDGDARGGAALSVKPVTGVPIKFIGTGEHLDALEEFHPDRMASRILGMGDVLTLVETAQREVRSRARWPSGRKDAQRRVHAGRLSRANGRRLARPGLMKKMIGMMPGMGGMREMMDQFDANQLTHLFGMIDSMTADERRNPHVIDQSRRRRIAAGSGVEPHEVNDLVKQFDGMASLMKEMSSLGMRDRMKKMQQLQQGGFLDPGNRLGRAKVGTGKRLTPDEKRKLKKQREKELRKKRRETRN